MVWPDGWENQICLDRNLKLFLVKRKEGREDDSVLRGQWAVDPLGGSRAVSIKKSWPRSYQREPVRNKYSQLTCCFY